MIKITYYKNNDIVTDIRCLGHAGYAAYGHDVVCSAVSVLVINTVNSIKSFTSDDFILREDEAKGELIFFTHSVPCHDTQLLLNSLLLGLTEIYKSYGKKYIQIIESDKQLT